MATVTYSQRAVADIRQIEEYISLDSVLYATRFVDELLLYTQQLSIYPLKGKCVAEFSGTSYAFREILFRNYRIVYEYNAVSDSVVVLAIVHGRRNMDTAFDPEFL